MINKTGIATGLAAILLASAIPNVSSAQQVTKMKLGSDPVITSFDFEDKDYSPGETLEYRVTAEDANGDMWKGVWEIHDDKGAVYYEPFYLSHYLEDKEMTGEIDHTFKLHIPNDERLLVGEYYLVIGLVDMRQVQGRSEMLPLRFAEAEEVFEETGLFDIDDMYASQHRASTKEKTPELVHFDLMQPEAAVNAILKKKKKRARKMGYDAPVFHHLDGWNKYFIEVCNIEPGEEILFEVLPYVGEEPATIIPSQNDRWKMTLTAAHDGCASDVRDLDLNDLELTDDAQRTLSGYHERDFQGFIDGFMVNYGTQKTYFAGPWNNRFSINGEKRPKVKKYAVTLANFPDFPSELMPAEGPVIEPKLTGFEIVNGFYAKLLEKRRIEFEAERKRPDLYDYTPKLSNDDLLFIEVCSLRAPIDVKLIPYEKYGGEIMPEEAVTGVLVPREEDHCARDLWNLDVIFSGDFSLNYGGLKIIYGDQQAIFGTGYYTGTASSYNASLNMFNPDQSLVLEGVERNRLEHVQIRPLHFNQYRHFEKARGPDNVEELMAAAASAATETEFDILSIKIDDFFDSGFIAYAARNELEINHTGVQYDYHSNRIVFNHTRGDRYIFKEDGTIQKNGIIYEMGNDDQDVSVAKDVVETLENTMASFENLDWDNMQYVVADPRMHSYDLFSIFTIAESTAFQLYKPDSAMGQMFIEQAKEEDIEFDREQVLIAKESEDGTFDYEVFP